MTVLETEFVLKMVFAFAVDNGKTMTVLGVITYDIKRYLYFYIDVCDFDRHRGYTVQLMDRVLISEAILKLGKELRYLKDQLEYVKERLPSYDEYLQNLRGGEQDIGQIYTISTSVEGVRYHSTCMTDSLLPIFNEFNEVLDATRENEPFYTPYTGELGNI